MVPVDSLGMVPVDSGVGASVASLDRRTKPLTTAPAC